VRKIGRCDHDDRLCDSLMPREEARRVAGEQGKKGGGGVGVTTFSMVLDKGNFAVQQPSLSLGASRPRPDAAYR